MILRCPNNPTSWQRILLPLSLFLSLLSLSGLAVAQQALNPKKQDSVAINLQLFPTKVITESDLIDLGLSLLNKKQKARKDSLVRKTGKLYVSAVPAAGYTLITGLAVTVAANGAFYTSEEENANVSSVLTEPAYTQYKQILIPMQANIWTPGNRYNIQTDWSYKKFPQDTYGLGGHNSLNSAYPIDYSHLRFYQTVFKTIRPDFFAGVGYYLDHFWDVREVAPPAGVITDFQKYGLTQKSTSSGITLNLLYDLRRNLINPKSGWYGNVVYRPNFTFMGSDSNWQTLLLDVRKYVSLPYGSRNILGFWNYDVLTLQGKPPYLALPFTGSDTYINSGRGYIQGRFRGQKMLYFETEYRFAITTNGLLGAVVFANVQSFSEPNSGKFEVLWPACGGGLRIKLNKFSRTNIALDYGFGAGGSRGIFVNLGEVF